MQELWPLGHWKEYCKKPPRKQRKEEAHHAEVDTDNPSILLATVNDVRALPCDVESSLGRATRHVVHLNKK